MKITNALKLSNVKAVFTKVAMVGLVAGAAFLATPTKANAQVSFGVRVGHARFYGGPRYYAPAPYYAPPVVYGPGPIYGRGFYGHGFYDHRYGWDHRRFYR